MFLYSVIISIPLGIMIHLLAKKVNNKFYRFILTVFLFPLAIIFAQYVWSELSYNSIVIQWNGLYDLGLTSSYKDFDEFYTKKYFKYLMNNIIYLSLGYLFLYFLYRKKNFANNDNWYYCYNDNQCGPYSYTDIVKFINERKINAMTLVWSDKMTNWVEAEKTIFASLFVPTQPPPIPKPPPLPNQRRPSSLPSNQSCNSTLLTGKVLVDTTKTKTQVKTQELIQTENPKKYICLKCFNKFESCRNFCISCKRSDFVAEQ